MKSFALLLAVIGSSILLAEAITPDVHDPSYRKTAEKGDYLDNPQQGSTAVHKHSDKAPHHDDSHSHEDSSEHRRHARDTEDEVEVGTRRLGGGSYSHGSRPGSGFGSGSHGTGFGHSSHGSSGLGSGSLHTGSGSLHTGSGLGHGSSHHSSGLGSGSHHSGSYYQGSSGLGSGSLHGSSGHHRRPSSVRNGTISFNDDEFVKMRKRSADQNSRVDSPISVEGDTVRLTNAEHSCLFSNVRDEVVENRRLQCNGEECSLLEQSNRHTAWKCGPHKCNILKFDIDKPLPSGLVFECTEERSLITAPKRCPHGSKVDWAGRCRPEF